MKHFISTILPTMLLCMFGAKAYAYDIAVNNADDVTIYYNFINDDSSTMIRNLRSPIFKIMMIMRLILIGTDLMMYMLGMSLSQKK